MIKICHRHCPLSSQVRYRRHSVIVFFLLQTGTSSYLLKVRVVEGLTFLVALDLVNFDIVLQLGYRQLLVLKLGLARLLEIVMPVGLIKVLEFGDFEVCKWLFFAFNVSEFLFIHCFDWGLLLNVWGLYIRVV